MPRHESNPNFAAIADTHTVVWDAEALPLNEWSRLRHVHEDALRGLTEVEDWGQVDQIVLDSSNYETTRINPNASRGVNGIKEDQLFRNALVAVTYNGQNQTIGAVLTENNSSAQHLPGPLKPAEYWAKMVVSPRLHLPLIGGKRHVRLREAYAYPGPIADMRNEMFDPTVASAISLAGLYASLQYRHPSQQLKQYLVPDDPTETFHLDLVRRIKLREIGREPNELTQFTGSDEVCVAAPVREVMKTIAEMPGAAAVLTPGRISRRTVRDVRRGKRLERRQEDNAQRSDFGDHHR